MTARLAEARHQVYQSNKLASVGRLAAGIAHEINNPLTGVLTYSSFLLKRATDEETKSDLETIVHETKRCRDIVRGLLDFARQVPPRKTQVDVNAVVERALDIVDNQLRVQNIQVTKSLESDLPSIPADANQVQQVLINLLVNAADAFESADRQIFLGTDLKRIDGRQMVEIKVADNGVGIPEKNLGRLFEPFFTTKENKGTGLGLAVCWGIVNEHGGDRVESRIGAAPPSPCGCRSTATGRPGSVRREHPVRRAPGRGRAGGARGGGAHLRRRADDRPRRDVAGARRLRKFEHRVVLCDLMLPGFSGFDLLERVTGELPGLPVILITGYATIENALRAFKKGAFDFLPKPFDVPELLGVVRRALRAVELGAWRSLPSPAERTAASGERGGRTSWASTPGSRWTATGPPAVWRRAGPVSSRRSASCACRRRAIRSPRDSPAARSPPPTIRSIASGRRSAAPCSKSTQCFGRTPTS
jgi:CheY-like chemotaxis protein